MGVGGQILVKFLKSANYFETGKSDTWEVTSIILGYPTSLGTYGNYKSYNS